MKESSSISKEDIMFKTLAHTVCYFSFFFPPNDDPVIGCWKKLLDYAST